MRREEEDGRCSDRRLAGGSWKSPELLDGGAVAGRWWRTLREEATRFLQSKEGLGPMVWVQAKKQKKSMVWVKDNGLF